jgi:hypothetical protein
MNHHIFQPQNLHDLNRYIANSDDNNLFIMDNYFANNPVAGNESHSKCQESRSVMEEPSPNPGKEEVMICTTCQRWANVLAEDILDCNRDRSLDYDQNRHFYSSRLPPFHLNLLSMVQSARVGCPFCIFYLRQCDGHYGITRTRVRPWTPQFSSN